MSDTDILQVRLRSVAYEAEGILSFELVPFPPARQLPAFEAGAHIDLSLPNGLIRSYSLLNDPGERHRYVIAVNRAPDSRGGSHYMHESLRPGATLVIHPPRNNFPFAEQVPLSVFIAGGIGITPIMSMIARARTLGRRWQLHYAARTYQRAAFINDLRATALECGAEFRTVFTARSETQKLDIACIVEQLPDDAHIYCCGPLRMLQRFRDATSALAPERVHIEYFSAEESAATDGGFTVELARSGLSAQVRPGQTVLDAVLELGVEPPYSCREGICGTCEVRVLDGVPDHRDLVLSPEQHAANDRMMLCCSGCKSPRLLLDL